MKKIILILVFVMVVSGLTFADDYGHEGVNDVDVDLEGMMIYALEDEILAYSTYEAIVEEFSVSRPFTNIMKAEETHIDLVKNLLISYDLEIPVVDPSAYIVLPETLVDAYNAGVEAEVLNIALYEKFLENDLPDDVRSTFEILISGSEKHLAAFERQVDKTSGTSNNRRGFGRWQ